MTKDMGSLLGLSAHSCPNSRWWLFMELHKVCHWESVGVNCVLAVILLLVPIDCMPAMKLQGV